MLQRKQSWDGRGEGSTTIGPDADHACVQHGALRSEVGREQELLYARERFQTD